MGVCIHMCMGENELGYLHVDMYKKSNSTLCEFLYNSTSYRQSGSFKKPEDLELLLV